MGRGGDTHGTFGEHCNSKAAWQVSERAAYPLLWRAQKRPRFTYSTVKCVLSYTQFFPPSLLCPQPFQMGSSRPRRSPAFVSFCQDILDTAFVQPAREFRVPRGHTQHFLPVWGLVGTEGTEGTGGGGRFPSGHTLNVGGERGQGRTPQPGRGCAWGQSCVLPRGPHPAQPQLGHVVGWGAWAWQSGMGSVFNVSINREVSARPARSLLGRRCPQVWSPLGEGGGLFRPPLGSAGGVGALCGQGSETRSPAAAGSHGRWGRGSGRPQGLPKDRPYPPGSRPVEWGRNGQPQPTEDAPLLPPTLQTLQLNNTPIAGQMVAPKTHVPVLMPVHVEMGSSQM